MVIMAAEAVLITTSSPGPGTAPELQLPATSQLPLPGMDQATVEGNVRSSNRSMENGRRRRAVFFLRVNQLGQRENAIEVLPGMTASAIAERARARTAERWAVWVFGED
jgi:hypothetical protein